MPIPEFTSKELKVVKKIFTFGIMPTMEIFNTPISIKEGYKAAMSKKPVWQIIGTESRMFSPRHIPDNVARVWIFDRRWLIYRIIMKKGGKDMFGMEWEYVPSAQGSMIRPGKPLMTDFNDWPDRIAWPEIDGWNWEGSSKRNEKYLKPDKYNNCWFMTGWFERLITFMDFENAVVALIDEDQKDAVKAFFDKLSDLYIQIFERFIKYFPGIDGFSIHDDWGSQKDTFFSPETVSEMIVPYMKRVTDYLHSKGKFCDLHSCGQISKQVPNIIAAGWDSWNPQEMNDTAKLHELYGSKLMIGVMPEKTNLKELSEKEQRLAAKDYADKFCRPDKPSFMNMNALYKLTPAFREELYKQSRINYSQKE